MSYQTELQNLIQQQLPSEAPYIHFENNLIHVPNVLVGEDILSIIENSTLEIEAMLDYVNLIVMVSEGRSYN